MMIFIREPGFLPFTQTEETFSRGTEARFVPDESRILSGYEHPTDTHQTALGYPLNHSFELRLPTWDLDAIANRARVSWQPHPVSVCFT